MAKTKRETARGFAASETTTLAVANTTAEVTLFSQLIRAGSMGASKEMRFTLVCELVTGAVVPDITLRLRFGASVLAFASPLVLSASQPKRPIAIEGLIVNTETGKQFVWVKTSGFASAFSGLLSFLTANTTADWTEDTTKDKLFSITSQYSAVRAGTTLTARHASIELS